MAVSMAMILKVQKDFIMTLQIFAVEIRIKFRFWLEGHLCHPPRETAGMQKTAIVALGLACLTLTFQGCEESGTSPSKPRHMTGDTMEGG